MDCEMPIMDGFEASKKIKKLIYKDFYTKVIIVGSTALLTEEVQQKGKKFGMDLMIPKPIEF